MSAPSDDGGAAFPRIQQIDRDGNVLVYEEAGMTLRDYFAAKLPSDEIQDMTYRQLSRDAQELLTGMKYPSEPPTRPGEMPPAEYRIAVVRFHAAVNAALRYIAADAMLNERAALARAGGKA